MQHPVALIVLCAEAQAVWSGSCWVQMLNLGCRCCHCILHKAGCRCFCCMMWLPVHSARVTPGMGAAAVSACCSSTPAAVSAADWKGPTLSAEAQTWPRAVATVCCRSTPAAALSSPYLLQQSTPHQLPFGKEVAEMTSPREQCGLLACDITG